MQAERSSAAEPRRPCLRLEPSLLWGGRLRAVNAVACWLVGLVEFGARRRARRRAAWELWGRGPSRPSGGGGRVAIVRDTESLLARRRGLYGLVGEHRVRFGLLQPLLRGQKSIE